MKCNTQAKKSWIFVVETRNLLARQETLFGRLLIRVELCKRVFTYQVSVGIFATLVSLYNLDCVGKELRNCWVLAMFLRNNVGL